MYTQDTCSSSNKTILVTSIKLFRGKKKMRFSNFGQLEKMPIFTQKAITLHTFYFIRNQASSLVLKFLKFENFLVIKVSEAVSYFKKTKKIK